jgi:hypothetical protein
VAVDHDQRFKVLLQEFFREFFELFFPEWAEYFDFTAVEWLDKEVFTDPPTGSRRFLDMVAKIKLKKPLPGQRDEESEHWLALIHVEIEHEDTVQPLRPRMYQYYEQLRRQYGLPVLPIGLYLGVGLSGIGIDVYEEYFGPLRVLQFQYLYVGLPALDARKYVAGNNWLGVALSALMRCPPEERTQLALESLQRLEICPENAWRRRLLGECICAYSPLTDDQREELADQLLAVTTDPESSMTKSLLDTLEERGWQKGVRHSLCIVLEAKFGPLNPAVLNRLATWPAEGLDPLLRAAAEAQSLQDLGLENGAGAQA